MKRFMQLVTVVLAMGALLQTAANAVEKGKSAGNREKSKVATSAPKDKAMTAADKSEPGI